MAQGGRIVTGGSAVRRQARSALSHLVHAGLSRDVLYRAGRALYSQARQDGIDLQYMDSELALQDVVLEHCDAGDAFIDVGANVGLWSAHALSRRQDILVHAYEPVPDTCEELTARLAGPIAEGRARVFAEALSRDRGTAEMHVFPLSSGRSGINSLYAPRASGTQPVRVNVTTLDEAVQRCAPHRPRMIKIDTEGHDVSALAGGGASIHGGLADVIQFEYNSRWIQARSYLRDVFDLISGADYSVGKVLGAGHIEIYDSWHPELERFFEANYVLVHHRVDYLPQRLVRFSRRNTPVPVSTGRRTPSR